MGLHLMKDPNSAVMRLELMGQDHLEKYHHMEQANHNGKRDFCKGILLMRLIVNDYNNWGFFKQALNLFYTTETKLRSRSIFSS